MVFDRRAVLTACLALPLAGAAAQASWTRPASLAPYMTVPLWPDGHIKPPFGLVEQLVQRSNDPRASDRMLQGISRARLDIFRPAKPNGAAAILAPGGGFRYVVIDKEGYELARWLKARGGLFEGAERGVKRASGPGGDGHVWAEAPGASPARWSRRTRKRQR